MVPEDNLSRQNALLAEYRAITDLHKHFDTMNLTMMSIIIAAVFILWGMILDTPHMRPIFIVFLSSVVLLILSSWIRYASIHRAIVVRKLARAWQIEEELGMYQNQWFRYSDEQRRTRRRPGAHIAEITVYLSLALIGTGTLLYNSIIAGLPSPIQFADISAAVQDKWYVSITALLQLSFSLYWGLLCRVLVAEVTPYFRPIGVVYRFLYWVGRYRDLSPQTDGPQNGQTQNHPTNLPNTEQPVVSTHWLFHWGITKTKKRN